MKSRIILCGVMLLALFGVAVAQKEASATAEKTASSGISNEKQFSDWMIYYYQHPQPELLAPSVHFLFSKKILTEQNAEALMMFYGRIIAENPARVAGWTAEFQNSTEGEKAFLAGALWSARTSEAKAALKTFAGGSDSYQKYVANLLAADPPDLLTKDVDSPTFLDELWSGFFVTGDERYVLRVISVLPWSKKKDDVSKILIGGAAQWSLMSNAQQHPKVLSICENDLPKADANVKPILAEVIQRAKKGKQ